MPDDPADPDIVCLVMGLSFSIRGRTIAAPGRSVGAWAEKVHGHDPEIGTKI
jgi:hypothetical protein